MFARKHAKLALHRALRGRRSRAFRSMAEPVVNGAAAAAAADEPPDAAWPAAVAARYKWAEKIGVGLFSEVFKAWDREGKRAVAVKHLRGRTDARFLGTELHQLAREAMSLRACGAHPRVVQLLATHADPTRPDGDCFLVMEYAGRNNLREHVLRRRDESILDVDGRPPFREREVRAAVVQLLSAVAHAHRAGVVHRDVEPASVVVRERRRAFRGRSVTYKLCGFGMSEPARKTDKDGLAKVAASAAYRAPELFLGSAEYDGRVDTWGLGCIMAEMLMRSGDRLFNGDQPDDETSLLRNVLETVGARGIKDWLRTQRQSVCDSETRKMVRKSPDDGRLRELFPKEVLSDDGFDVLAGLLETNPVQRLTAEAALDMPWFTKQRRRGCFAV